MTLLTIAVMSFVATLLLLRVLSVIATHLDLVDQPGERKVHQDAVPLVGGLAVFGGIVFGLLLSPVPLGEFRILFAGAASLLVVGVLDDLHELSARARFAAQILAAVLMIGMGDVLLRQFGPILGPWPLGLGPLAAVLTVFCTVGVINAINMMDGIDGLAGTILLTALVSLLVAEVMAGGTVSALLVAIVAATSGFLVSNLRIVRPARVFLGDAGALSLGYALAWLLIDKSQQPGAVIEPVTALWIFALPLLDTVFVMLMRLSQSRSPFRAGQDHIHHLFLRAGFSVNATLARLAAFCMVLAAVGLIAQAAGIPAWLRFYSFLLLAGIYYKVISRAWRRGLWLGRPVEAAATQT